MTHRRNCYYKPNVDKFLDRQTPQWQKFVSTDNNTLTQIYVDL